MEAKSEVFETKVRRVLNAHGRKFSDILCVRLKIVTADGNIFVSKSVDSLGFDYDYTMSGFGVIALKGGDFLEVYAQNMGTTYHYFPKCSGFFEKIRQIIQIIRR